MAFVHGGARTVQAISRHFGRAGVSAVRGIGRAINTARPAYEAVRPALHHYGVNTAIVDKSPNTYDGIRRAIGK